MMLSTAGQLARPFNDDQLVYFRLMPSLPAMQALDGFRLAHGLPRTFRRERLHVTLLPLGDIRLIAPAAMQRIHQAAASLRAEPFPVVLHRLFGNCLRGKHMHAAKDFQRQLVRRLEAFDVPVPDYDFDPHVTLAYTDWQPRSMTVDPIGWTASEFLLVNSIHGKGPVTLGRWALEARQGSLF